MLAAPLLVLGLTRVGVEISIRLSPPIVSWIPAFIGYYLAIGLMLYIAKRYFEIPITQNLSLSFKPYPRFNVLFWTIVIPALLPLTGFITQLKFVPLEFLFYIFIFACINPFFEEFFWRGLLSHLPGNNTFRLCYSAGLFSFSHYFFWSYWFKYPIIIIPTLVATFIMGMLWMRFIQKEKNIIYPIVSHIVVDILNLSVAVYCGFIRPEHF
ncbi:MAG: CPBP family intramembrane glutamic endopeptidase [Pseudomonadota bacterium]